MHHWACTTSTIGGTNDTHTIILPCTGCRGADLDIDDIDGRTAWGGWWSLWPRWSLWPVEAGLGPDIFGGLLMKILLHSLLERNQHVVTAVPLASSCDHHLTA